VGLVRPGTVEIQGRSSQKAVLAVAVDHPQPLPHRHCLHLQAELPIGWQWNPGLQTHLVLRKLAELAAGVAKAQG
jgi:hypothetical protein